MQHIYNLLKKVWHYFKCVIILHMELPIRKRKKFAYFGNNAVINCPMLQLTNEKNISIGDDTTILTNSRLAVYGDCCEKEKTVIKIGNRCYIGFGFSALAVATGRIKIGDDVLIASNVLVTNENHGIDPESQIPYMDQPLSCNDVEICEGCWIGENVGILPGVTIGKKSIIGAGSIVTKSIPDYSIAVGNPARVIKQYNFEKHEWIKVD